MTGPRSGEKSAFPDFYIAGAAKSGTTSLWNYLGQHPDIWLGPIKEPNFFAFGPDGPNVVGPAPADELRRKLHCDSIVRERDYLALFAGAQPNQLRGEASVRYLYSERAAERIAAARPDARITIILRDPIERLRSHYAMNRAAGLEPLDLPAALEAEDDRIAAGWGWDWHYVSVGLYSEQVRRYFDAFEREQMLVLRHEELQRDPIGTVETVCAHLGISTDFVPETSMRSKEAYIPRSRAVDSLRRNDTNLRRALTTLLPSSATGAAGRWLRRMNHESVPALDERAVARLEARFADDTLQLERLLQESPRGAHST